MLTLAINTSSSVEAVALLKGKKLLGEISWKSDYDESQKLLPKIEKLLKKHGAKWADLERIIAVNGPGPFSAVRIGVTVANTLALLTGAKLFSLGSLEFWSARKPEKSAVLLLHAGSRFVAVCKEKGAIEILPVDEVILRNPNVKTFYGDITDDEMDVLRQANYLPAGQAGGECRAKLRRVSRQAGVTKRARPQDDKKNKKFINQKSLLSFGQILLKLKQKSLKRCKILTPEYFRPPNITMPKKLYKKN